MTEDELLSAVEREEANCNLHQTSLLSEQRRKAMQYYYGQPYGNEVEGRSQVVTTEVKDAVEGQMPPLMAMFTASGDIVRCDPRKPEDEEIAQQATDYINWVFGTVNNGFVALYCGIKDALLQKTGYVKVYWEDYEDQSKEEYEDLDDMQFRSLVDDPELELMNHTEKPDPQAQQQIAMQVQVMQARGMPIPPIPEPHLHDAVFKRTKKYGKICIDPIPPEEVLVSRDAGNDLTKARFVEHRTLRTLSDIREMGYDVEDGIADYAPNADFNLERVERLKYDDALAYRQDSEQSDPSTKQVWLCEAYIHIDYDGDGIAELRKVTKVGKQILDNEEFDSLPIIAITALMVPHKHQGLSVFDEIGDIQFQKSTVLRQLFDNAYVANNGRMEVLENMVNMADLLTARPNGVVRVKAMGSVKRIDNPLLGAPFYNLLEYLDKIKQNRVGATDFPNAVDPDAINAKATFVETYRNAALERTNLKGRIIGETGVKAIAGKILELSAKHQNKPQMVKLRGKWTEVDPREWHNRFDLIVTVGVGTGNQQNTIQGVNMLAQIVAGAYQIGVGPRIFQEQNLYQLSHLAAKALFPRYADVLVTNPQTLPPPQPQPNPELIKLQLQDHKQQVAAMQKDQKMQLDAANAERDRQFQGAMLQFQAMVEGFQKDKDQSADVAKQVLEMASQQRQLLTEKLADLKITADQQQHEKDNTVLQGMIQALLDKQQQIHEATIENNKLAQAEREMEVTERDNKGKVKKATQRIKK